MWELALIARDFDIRRLSIFEDIDRKDGPMWSQVYVTCLNVIKSIEERIDNYGKPPIPPPAAAPAADPLQPPQRIVEPPRTDNVWAAAPARTGLRSSIGKLATRVVTSPGKTPAEVYLPEAKRKAIEATDHFLTKEQREALTTEGVNTLFQNLVLRVLSLPQIGSFFQQPFGRQFTTAVLGQPFGEVSIYVNAACALSRLAVSSLVEDRYGNVQRDVPTIIRTFTTVIKKLELFRDNLPIHWTDLGKTREYAKIQDILDALKDGLQDLIDAFGQYSTDLRLTRADMRLAREAAERPREAANAGVANAVVAAPEAQIPMQQVR